MLMNNNIMKYNGRNIELHDQNPYTSEKIPSEKIVIRELPCDIENKDVIAYIEQNFPHVIIRSGVILTRIPSRENNLTQYYNGDRVIYAKQGFYPVLPKYGQINGINCKIWHTNQEMFCTRCETDEHRTIDSSKCEIFQDRPGSIVFKSDEDPKSNFYVCKEKINVYGREWSTVEHAYQWKKMMDHGHLDLAQEIIAATTARGAKNIANQVPSYKLTNWGKDLKISVMKTILEAKLTASNEFRLALEEGKGRLFIEGTMDTFWGAGIPYHVAVHTNPQKLRGENQMGKLLDQLRDNMMNNSYITPAHSGDPTPSQEPRGASTHPGETRTSSPSPLQGEKTPFSPPPMEASSAAQPSKNKIDPLPQKENISQTVVMSDPPLVEMDKPSAHSHISETEGVKVIEHDFELFPRHVMVPDNLLMIKRKSRSLNKLLNPTRSKSCYKADRRDMRQIDDYFAPGKRKAIDAVTSPNSESVPKMTRTGKDTDPVSAPPLVMDETDYDTGCTAD